MEKMYTEAQIDEKSFNDDEQSFVAWASKPVLDRDKEIIEWDAWNLERFDKNPVIIWAHDYSKPPVGRSVWHKTEKEGLKFKPTFANTDMGKELYQLYKDKILNAFSVGFVAHDKVDGDEDDVFNTKYTDCELLEISCVSIPSCPEALVEHYEGNKIKTKGLQEAVEHVIGKNKEPDEEKAETVNKPETTEDYHRMPVRECNITATITISAAKGIKALYCGNEKTVATYLFDVNKWTMDEAKAWVKEHDDGKGLIYIYRAFDGFEQEELTTRAADGIPYEPGKVTLSNEEIEKINIVYSDDEPETKEGRVLSEE